MSKHAKFWVGEAKIEEHCDCCGEVELLQQIELQGYQFLCRKCRDAQPVCSPIPQKVIRRTA